MIYAERNGTSEVKPGTVKLQKNVLTSFIKIQYWPSVSITILPIVSRGERNHIFFSNSKNFQPIEQNYDFIRI